MSTTLQQPSQVSSASIGEQLQAETTAVRLRIRWPGVRKTLSETQRRLAARTFDADRNSVSASKKLLDTRHPAFRAATSVKTQAIDYWKRNSLPYVDPGVRLIRREAVPNFDVYMTTVQSELTDVVAELRRHYGEMVEQARTRLGNLFDPGDYPPNLNELFGIEWDYPATEAPNYLLQVSPHLYQVECERVKQRFDDAVRLAEQAFAEELSQLVSHLAERLSGGDSGTPKVFRDSAVANLLEFFDRFGQLNIRSDAALDRLVSDAGEVVRGVVPQDLRDQSALRQHVQSELVRVEASLEGWMTNRPRRNIIRRAK